MKFSESEIEDKARQLAEAGVGQKDIETWIDLARRERDVAMGEASPEQPAAPKSPMADLLARGIGAATLTHPAGLALQTLQAGPTTTEQLGTDAAYLAKMGGEMGLRAGAITAGQAAGLRAPGMLKAAAVPAMGALSAGMTDIALQKAKGQPYSLGQTAEEAIIGTLPGVGTYPPLMSTARTAVRVAPKVLEYFASPQGFRTLTTLYSAKAAKTGIEEGRAPTAGEAAQAIGATAIAGKTSVAAPTSKQVDQARRMSEDAVTNTNVREWLAKGGAVDTSLSYRESAVNRGMAAAAGTPAVQRDANIVNNRAVQRLGKEQMGFPETQSLQPINFTDLISKNSASLREIEQLPSAGGASFADAVRDLRLSREQSKRAWEVYRSAAEKGRVNTEAREEAQRLTQIAANNEQNLEQMLRNQGRGDLAADWRRDRTKLATIYAYRDALIEGNFSPAIIYDHYTAHNRQLTGNLSLIARMYGTMPKVMRDIRDVQTTTSTVPEMIARTVTPAATLATGGYLSGASPVVTAGMGVAGAAVPMAAQRIMRNPLYQRLMATPRYGPEDPAFAASLARFAGVGETAR